MEAISQQAMLRVQNTIIYYSQCVRPWIIRPRIIGVLLYYVHGTLRIQGTVLENDGAEGGVLSNHVLSPSEVQTLLRLYLKQNLLRVQIIPNLPHILGSARNGIMTTEGCAHLINTVQGADPATFLNEAISY